MHLNSHIGLRQAKARAWPTHGVSVFVGMRSAGFQGADAGRVPDL